MTRDDRKMPVHAIALVPAGRRAWVQVDPGMSRLFNALEAGPAKAPNLKGAAMLAMVSESTFKRGFKEMSRLSWSDFVREWRLVNAWMLLALPDMTSQMVMSLVGFESSSSFARAFKKRFGGTPHEVHEAALQGQVTSAAPPLVEGRIRSTWQPRILP